MMTILLSLAWIVVGIIGLVLMTLAGFVVEQVVSTRDRFARSLLWVLVVVMLLWGCVAWALYAVTAGGAP